ncbi:MAG: hypothetical protein IJ787_00790 [Bacilli bacterium]|nr:hypothetical protein [Bacilli bacterium]
MKEKPTEKRAKKKESIPAGADDTLKEMVSALNELPTDVLEQLLHNLEEIEKYNKEHPKKLEEDE